MGWLHSCPAWFQGKDILIDLAGILVLAFIAAFAAKCYSFSGHRNYLVLSVSFCLIAFAFLVKILTNFALYNTILRGMWPPYAILLIGLLLYRILTLLGLYTLYSLFAKQGKSTMFLIVFFIIITMYLSQLTYYIFHFTALVFLAIITLHYSRLSSRKRRFGPKLIASSFGILFLSQALFLFAGLSSICYVIAEFIQLVGFAALLASFFQVRYGKKKQD
jgi:hypothetical protein